MSAPQSELDGAKPMRFTAPHVQVEGETSDLDLNHNERFHAGPRMGSGVPVYPDP